MSKAASQTEDYTVLRERAWDLKRAGEYAKGLKIIDQVLAITDQDPASFNCKARLLYELGQYIEAIKYYQIGLGLAKKENDLVNQFKIHANWSTTYRTLKNDEENINHLREALKVADVLENSEYQLIILRYLPDDLKHLERYEEAIPYYKRLVKFPDKWCYNDSLAEVYEALGRYQEAYDAWLVCAEHEPAHIIHKYQIAKCLMNWGKDRESALWLKDIITFLVLEPKLAYGNVTNDELTLILDFFEENAFLLFKYYSAELNALDTRLNEQATNNTETADTGADNPAHFFKQFMAQIQAQVKANSEAVAKAATATARLEDIALTETNSPALVRVQTDAKVREAQSARIEANPLLKQYQEAFYFFIDTTVTEVFAAAARGGYLARNKPGGIPFADAISAVLPPIAQQCVKALDVVVESYRRIKQHNELHSFASIFSKVDNFKLIAKEAARFIAMTCESDITAADVERTGLLGFWDKAQKVKAKVITNPYDTPVKQLAMQHASMLFSGLCKGVFDFATPLGEQFIVYLHEDVVRKNMAEELAQSRIISNKKGCTIMCITDIEYDNPVLNDAKLVKELISDGKLDMLLSFTTEHPETAASLCELYHEDGLLGIEAWWASIYD